MSSLNIQNEKEFRDSNEEPIEKESEAEYKTEKRSEAPEPNMDEAIGDKLATDLNLNDSDESYSDDDDYDYEYDIEENKREMLSMQNRDDSDAEELKKFEESLANCPCYQFEFSETHPLGMDLVKVADSYQEFLLRQDSESNLQNPVDQTITKHEDESHCEKGNQKDKEMDVSKAK